MSRYVVTRRADKDLDAIWDWIADGNGPAIANRIERELHEAMNLLAEFPEIGHTRPDVKNPRYRFWALYNFVIAYRTDRTPLHVARVIHGARDFRRLFR
jgi:toxin ParE1/3/4